MNAKKISALLCLAKWRDRKEEEQRKQERKWCDLECLVLKGGKEKNLRSNPSLSSLLFLLFFFLIWEERKGNGPWLIFLTFPLFLSTKQGMYFFSPQIKRRRSKLFVTYLVPVIMTFPTKLIFFHLPNESKKSDALLQESQKNKVVKRVILCWF